MSDLEEYYQTEYFRVRDINTKLMKRYDKLNSKYCKLIRKYKKLINNHDELISSFLRVEYAFKCYKQSLVPLKNELVTEQTTRYDKCARKLINAISAMLAELEECGLLERINND